MSVAQIYANGVNGVTGEYLLEPLAASSVAARAKDGIGDPDEVRWMKKLAEAREMQTFGPRFDVKPEVLSSAGWAIVFADDEYPAVHAALEPLVEHRRQTVGDERTKVLYHHAGERWTDWLARHKTAPGNVVPKKVPYYVLLVGSPERIPFDFQYLLDVEYAVGRIDFEDPTGYERYAAAVIEYEGGDATPRDRSIAFFGTRHPLDGATELSAGSLLAPLAAGFDAGGDLADDIAGYRVERAVGDVATKGALAELFSGAGTAGRPALLFSATHGMGGWPRGHPDLETHSGALLCQDWPGLGGISADDYFAGADLSDDSDVKGLIAFFFACYGAGTPAFDAFLRKPGEPAEAIADAPFVAHLPKALLRAGALAVVGHVERAWGYSFIGATEPQIVPFQNALGRTLTGEPIGHAMKDFNERYSVLSANLLGILDDIERGGRVVPDDELASLWTERSDAQNYVLLGDPAVRIV